MHSRCIRQIFPLPRHARFDNARKEDAHRTQNREPETDDEDDDCAAIAASADVMSAAQDEAAREPEHHDAEQDAHQPYVESHVAVEDVAELVCDHALKFVPVEKLERAAGDGDGRIGRRVTCRERVDTALFLEHEDIGHRHPGSDRHLLDDIVQPLAQRVGGIRGDQRSTQLRGDLVAAG